MSYSFGNPARRIQNGDEDTRYRLSITLIATKRPSYWSFHCPMCGNKVCELSGTLISISDGADINAAIDYEPTPLNVRCQHKYCKLWLEFLTLSGRPEAVLNR